LYLYKEEAYLLIKKLMKILNWSGVVHIDMVYDETEKFFKIHEVNTRF